MLAGLHAVYSSRVRDRQHQWVTVLIMSEIFDWSDHLGLVSEKKTTKYFRFLIYTDVFVTNTCTYSRDMVGRDRQSSGTKFHLYGRLFSFQSSAVKTRAQLFKANDVVS